MDRYFSPEGGDVYGAVNWTRADVGITDEKGKLIFTQKDAEFPEEWTGLARKVVTSKYFYGEQNTPERETSAKQLISRVSSKFEDWFFSQGYASSSEEAKVYADEIASLALSQRMAFNSPVWFNVGIDLHVEEKGTEHQKESYVLIDGQPQLMPIGHEYGYPQTSACFIQSVEDNMESILRLSVFEGLLFKYGSGTGTDLSTLRSSHEKLSGGGVPSGPMKYLMFYDDVAGIVKSGGITRRAAKMNSLLVTHPDIEKFVLAKQKEEEKIRILVEGGIPEDEAKETVAYQNANLSVRVTNEYMEAVLEDRMWKTKPVHSQEVADQMPEFKARKLWRMMAESAHQCGDPGIQYHDTINEWHTCPNSGSINASNPCSEYMFLDDSACNLASLNLMKFRTEDGGFDVESFKKAIDLTIRAQDAVVDLSSYPRPEILENAHNFRPLGLGYANLGSLIMSLGIAYGSDEARAVAASITALMSGQAYQTSTELAEQLGTFNGFDENKEPMLNVMGKHSDALLNVDRSKLPEGLENILDAAGDSWSDVLKRGDEHGFRNAQVTVLAPTGTIGFMMDCDTTGVEPDIALVKYKMLAGGGRLKIVNNTVPMALNVLGYNPTQIAEMTDFIDEHETIEGAPHLREEHLNVFDCAFKPQNGERSIHYSDHLDMMAAVQPFLSGAISKTVNMPADATPDDIANAYMDGWKKGLKAVAVYIDGTKVGQPVSTGKGTGLESKLGDPAEAILSNNGRRRMPAFRTSKTHKAKIGETDFYMTMGEFDDGTLGELFLDASKEGTIVSGLLDSFGVAISVGLQYGVPLEAYSKKFIGQRFEPHGPVALGGDIGKLGEEIGRVHMAKSPVDYIFRIVDGIYGKKDPIQEGDVEEEVLTEQAESSREEIMQKLGKPIEGAVCEICDGPLYPKGKCDSWCPDCNLMDRKGCEG